VLHKNERSGGSGGVGANSSPCEQVNTTVLGARPKPGAGEVLEGAIGKGGKR
jgi:hypothetical protein